mgnify:CR=1 FL=1
MTARTSPSAGSGRRVVVLGSTGSIGTQTLDIAARNPERFRVVALAAGGSDPRLLAEQVQATGAELVAVADAEAARGLRDLLRDLPEDRLPRILAGPDASAEAAAWPCDVVVNGMAGAAGLRPTLAALRAGRTLALANKESLIVGGPLVKALARPGQIVPVDSEHSALAQALLAGRPEEVRRLILTASGGPFRGWDRERLAGVTLEQALAHPTWAMGPLVTINSATLMNKGLEVIEAHLLFDVPFDRIDVVVHPQSVVHSMVEFVDGSTIAQASPPDMRIPIACGMAWPDRVPDAAPACDWTRAATWEFLPLDGEAFPAVALARRAGTAGGTAPAVFNGADEACVAAFMDGRLPFLGIVDTVARVLEEHLGGAAEMLLQHPRDRVDDAEEGQPTVHEGRHAGLVGAVEHRRGRAPRRSGPAGEGDRWEGLPVQGQELPGCRTGPVAGGGGVGHAVGPGHPAGDGDAHVGRTGLGDRRAVDELDHRVHDRLRMDDDVDAVEGDVEEQVRLDHLQALVHQGRGVDGDQRAHRPGRVREGLLEGHPGQAFAVPPAERSAAGREDQPPHLLGPARKQRLRQRRVLGVDRHDLAGAREGLDQRAADDERLLVGQGESATGTQSREGRAQARCAGHSVHHDVAGPRGRLGAGVGAGKDPRQAILGEVPQQVAQPAGGLGVRDGDKLRPGGLHLLREEARVAATGRQRDDAEALGIAGGDVEGLGADGPRAAQNDDPSPAPRGWGGARGHGSNLSRASDWADSANHRSARTDGSSSERPRHASARRRRWRTV